jgi:hypothetical protein
MVDTNTARPVFALTPVEHAAILERFQEEPIRFLIWTTVIDDGTPEIILNHLHRNYAPFWGNIWLYAPQCSPAASQVNLLFSGLYTIETETPGDVQIDDRCYSSGETLELECGRHTVVTPVRVRLKLKPTGIDHLLDPAYCDPVTFFWPDRWPVSDQMRHGVWVKD